MENQAIAQRPNEQDIQKSSTHVTLSHPAYLYNRRFHGIAYPYDAHYRQQYPFARFHGVWRKYGHLWHDTDFEPCLQNRICSYRQYN